MPPLPDALEVARCSDRLYRTGASHRAGVTITEVPRGWARLRPGGEHDAFASTAFNRVHWLTLDAPITRNDLIAADTTLRALDVRRAFLWLSAAGVAGDGDAELRRLGAERVPFVRYLTLARPATPATPPKPAPLGARLIPLDELPGTLDAVSDWYGKDGIPAALSMARAGVSEFHGAFEGATPVALGALLMDRGARGNGWGYLGWAGTDPRHRGRGAQSALIASRVSRAAELGAAWCISETNTAVETSLRNLMRIGFLPAAEWCVYDWRA
ncbi:MAG: hypothetical protein JNM07_07475 [Phycisphaerae bacterium]|nr:hypothetical protein [Phycisphaerae bacterium]